MVFFYMYITIDNISFIILWNCQSSSYSWTSI